MSVTDPFISASPRPIDIALQNEESSSSGEGENEGALLQEEEVELYKELTELYGDDVDRSGVQILKNRYAVCWKQLP